MIRFAEPSDAGALAAFAAETFRDAFGADNRPDDLARFLAESYGPAHQARELADPAYATLVAERDGAFVAYAQLREGAAPACVHGPRPLEVLRFYVARAWHGRGLAQQLMQRVTDVARDRGARTLWLGVWERNPRAQAFYRKAGFADVGAQVFMVGADAQADRVMARPIGAAASAPTIVNVGYRSTNFWVLTSGRSRFLVDLGWAGMFGALEAELKRKDIPLREITHGFATHYHIDHAGCAQDLKNRGMRLLVTPEQAPFIDRMKQDVKPGQPYTEIRSQDNVIVPVAGSRTVLSGLGLAGQLVHTPGHSDDSVSLLLDSGEAFTGDLTHPEFMTEETANAVLASWDRLRELGASVVYAGHGPVRPMPGRA